jgi:hypothetical protein
MNANQIASLIGLTTQAHVNYQLDSKETADITAALFKLAETQGVYKETLTALREFRIQNYEAPANG